MRFFLIFCLVTGLSFNSILTQALPKKTKPSTQTTSSNLSEKDKKNLKEAAKEISKEAGMFVVEFFSEDILAIVEFFQDGRDMIKEKFFKKSPRKSPKNSGKNREQPASSEPCSKAFK